jgi:hypothetical protein
MNNTQQYYGLKELNSVVIRAYKDITIGNRKFLEGEPILYFEKIQISELNEQSSSVSAKGGYGNYSQVVWETFNNINFALTEGVLSKTSFSILTNCEIFDYEKNEQIIKIPKREIAEVYKEKIQLLYKPLTEKFFIYELDEDEHIKEKITSYTIDNKSIILDKKYDNKKILVDYYFNYENSYNKYIIGNKRIDGFLSLEGKAYFVDDKYGIKKTFLFEIPKMKITSNLDIVMGEKASPNVSVFNIVGLPIKENNQFIVSKMFLLDDDIDNDI